MNKVEKRIKEKYEKEGWIVLRNGWPDFLIIKKVKSTEEGDVYKAFGVEVKSPADKLSSAQQKIIGCIKYAGLETIVEIIVENDRERIVKEKYEAQGWTVLRNGWPDFLLISQGRKIIKGLEVKVPGFKGGLSEDQLRMRMALQSIGIEVSIEILEDVYSYSSLYGWREKQQLLRNRLFKNSIDGEIRFQSKRDRWGNEDYYRPRLSGNYYDEEEPECD